MLHSMLTGHHQGNWSRKGLLTIRLLPILISKLKSANQRERAAVIKKKLKNLKVNLNMRGVNPPGEGPKVRKDGPESKGMRTSDRKVRSMSIALPLGNLSLKVPSITQLMSMQTQIPS